MDPTGFPMFSAKDMKNPYKSASTPLQDLLTSVRLFTMLVSSALMIKVWFFSQKKILFQLFATVNRTFLSIDAIPSFYKKNISPMIYNVLEFKKNKFLKTLTF